MLNSPCCSRVGLPLISSRLKKYVLLETGLIPVLSLEGFATRSGAIELHSETSGGGGASFFESYLCCVWVVEHVWRVCGCDSVDGSFLVSSRCWFFSGPVSAITIWWVSHQMDDQYEVLWIYQIAFGSAEWKQWSIKFYVNDKFFGMRGCVDMFWHFASVSQHLGVQKKCADSVSALFASPINF